MIKALLLLMLVIWGVGCSTVKYDANSKLTEAQFQELDKKKPPEGFVDDAKKTTYEAQQKKTRAENKELKEQQKKLNQDIDTLQNKDIKLLDGDIEFYKSKNKMLEQTRDTLLNSISKTRNDINQFNKAVMSYASEQLDSNSHIVLGIPAFPRNNDKLDFPVDQLLVVNLSYPANEKAYAVGGELVTRGMGKARFAVLHRRDDGSYDVEMAGDEIEVTEADKDANGGFFRKSLLFSDNFAELDKDDLWGLVCDSGLGLTYDNCETGSSFVLDFKNQKNVRCFRDNKAFSFCLFVQAIDK